MASLAPSSTLTAEAAIAGGTLAIERSETDESVAYTSWDVPVASVTIAASKVSEPEAASLVLLGLGFSRRKCGKDGAGD
jgi:hypothetical protein